MADASIHAIDAEPPSPDTIETLESVLVMARDGKLSSVAVAVVYRDGTSGQAWSHTPSLSCLIGAVERLKYGILEFAG